MNDQYISSFIQPLFPAPEPGSASDGAESLYGRWRRRFSSIAGLKRFLLLPVISISVLIIFYLLKVVQNYYLSWNPAGADIYIVILTGLFLVTRIQLAVTPALLAGSEFKKQNWGFLRITTVKTSEVFRAIYNSAWGHCVLITGMLMFIETCVLIDLQRRVPEAFQLHNTLLLLGCMFLAGFILSGLALLGLLVLRNTYGIFTGVILPYIALILVGIGPVSELLGIEGPGRSLYLDYFYLISIPDYFLADMYLSILRFGHGSNQTTFLDSLMTLFFTALAIWIIARQMLWYRRVYG